jgi:iron complex outermembrane receptor protein
VLGGVDFDFIAGEYRTVTGGTAAGFPRKSVRLISPYASINHRMELAGDWFVRPSLGARHFDHSFFANEFAPQAALMAGGGGFEFHVSGARGINYPGLFVMAIPPGNNRHRELEAERINHWELGASRRFGTLAKAELTFFRDRGSDRIVTVFPPLPPVWKNLGRFRTEGVEVAFTLAPERRLSFYGGVTAMSSSPGDLPYTPDWAASAGLNWRFGGKFHLSLDSQYVGSRYASTRIREFTAVNSTRLGSYTLLNARLAGEFRLTAWNLAGEWFVAGENLGNTDYQQKDGYPMPGLGGTFGIKLKF